MKLIDAAAERFGLNAYITGKYDKAEKWFRRLEKKEPDSIRVLRNLGIILMAKGDPESAERYLLREEKLYGESIQRHRALADVAYAAGKREEAARRYRAALAGADAESGAQSFLEARIGICADPERFRAALKGAALFAEGEAARARGAADEALSAYLAAAEADPTNWPAMNNAGVILLEREDGAARALELFRNAARCAAVPSIERNIAFASSLAEKKLPTKARPH